MNTRNFLLLAAAVIAALTCAAPRARARQDDGPQVTQPDPQPRPDRPPRRPRPGGPRPDGAGPRAPADAAAPSTDKPPKKEDKNKKDVYFAVKNATVHTVSGPVLQNATIVRKNGKIAAVGRTVTVPEGAETIDAAGFHIYPGLVAVRSLALVGGEPPEDTSDVFQVAGVAALAGGVTTLVTGNTAAKLTFGTLDDMIVKRNLFENIRYRAGDPAGKRRFRESLDKARQYLRDLHEYEERKAKDGSGTAPDDKPFKAGEAAAHLRLLKGEAIGLADAETTYELLQLCDLADEYGIRIVARGAREGWTVAPQLARSGIAAIITPRTRDDPDPRMLRPNGGTIQNAAILYEHGVTVAIIPSGAGISFGGLGGRDLLQLNLEAAFGVRGGLPEDAALRAITLDAARVLGIDDRVGSIEAGKDADFVIADGDILHYTTLARWTIVNGKVAYDKSKEPLFGHIRPNGDPNPPPPKDYWPRRLGQDE